jgi:REP element-mobilizing transposase RayT
MERVGRVARQLGRALRKTARSRSKVVREPEQLRLPLKRGRGGARPGAGRKRKANATRHDKRPNVTRHKPQHVSLRVHKDVGRLRRRDAYRAVRGAVATCIGRLDFRIVHVSIQANHVHLLVEADDKRALANGLRAFMISGAKRLNKLRRRKGVVFTQRYHAVAIGSPRQARSALAYVLNNWRRHREDLERTAQSSASVDPYSTGVLFDGWDVPFEKFAYPAWYEPMAVHAPRSWLLTVGWRTHPRIGVREVPGPIA